MSDSKVSNGLLSQTIEGDARFGDALSRG